MKLTEDEWKEVQGKRVRGGVAMTTTGQGVRIKTGGEGPNQSGLSNVRASAASGVAGKAPSPNKEKQVRGAKQPGRRDVPQPGKAWQASTDGPGHKSAPSPNKPPYKSKLELSWAMRLEVMKRQGEIDGWVYEPFTFRLAEGKRYRADFIGWKWVESIQVDGSSVGYYVTTCYECKGWHKNYRDSLTHLSWAAQRFPFFSWKKVVRNGKSGFEVYDVVV